MSFYLLPCLFFVILLCITVTVIYLFITFYITSLILNISPVEKGEEGINMALILSEFDPTMKSEVSRIKFQISMTTRLCESFNMLNANYLNSW